MPELPESCLLSASATTLLSTQVLGQKIALVILSIMDTLNGASTLRPIPIEKKFVVTGHQLNELRRLLP